MEPCVASQVARIMKAMLLLERERTSLSKGQLVREKLACAHGSPSWKQITRMRTSGSRCTIAAVPHAATLQYEE